MKLGNIIPLVTTSFQVVASPNVESNIDKYDHLVDVSYLNNKFKGSLAQVSSIRGVSSIFGDVFTSSNVDVAKLDQINILINKIHNMDPFCALDIDSIIDDVLKHYISTISKDSIRSMVTSQDVLSLFTNIYGDIEQKIIDALTSLVPLNPFDLSSFINNHISDITALIKSKQKEYGLDLDLGEMDEITNLVDDIIDNYGNFIHLHDKTTDLSIDVLWKTLKTNLQDTLNSKEWRDVYTNELLKEVEEDINRVKIVGNFDDLLQSYNHYNDPMPLSADLLRVLNSWKSKVDGLDFSVGWDFVKPSMNEDVDTTLTINLTLKGVKIKEFPLLYHIPKYDDSIEDKFVEFMNLLKEKIDLYDFTEDYFRDENGDLEDVSYADIFRDIGFDGGSFFDISSIKENVYDLGKEYMDFKFNLVLDHDMSLPTIFRFHKDVDILIHFRNYQKRAWDQVVEKFDTLKDFGNSKDKFKRGFMMNKQFDYTYPAGWNINYHGYHLYYKYSINDDGFVVMNPMLVDKDVTLKEFNEDDTIEPLFSGTFLLPKGFPLYRKIATKIESLNDVGYITDEEESLHLAEEQRDPKNNISTFLLNNEEYKSLLENNPFIKVTWKESFIKVYNKDDNDQFHLQVGKYGLFKRFIVEDIRSHYKSIGYLRISSQFDVKSGIESTLNIGYVGGNRLDDVMDGYEGSSSEEYVDIDYILDSYVTKIKGIGKFLGKDNLPIDEINSYVSSLSKYVEDYKTTIGDDSFDVSLLDSLRETTLNNMKTKYNEFLDKFGIVALYEKVKSLKSTSFNTLDLMVGSFGITNDDVNRLKSEINNKINSALLKVLSTNDPDQMIDQLEENVIWIIDDFMKDHKVPIGNLKSLDIRFLQHYKYHKYVYFGLIFKILVLFIAIITSIGSIIGFINGIKILNLNKKLEKIKIKIKSPKKQSIISFGVSLFSLAISIFMFVLLFVMNSGF